MTANPFAALLDGVRRYECKPTPLDRHANMVLETDVLAALAAAVSADLAEAVEGLEGVTPGPWTEHDKGKHPNPYVCGATEIYEHGEDKPVVAYVVGMNDAANRRFIAWCREGVPALLARIAAQEAQMKGLEATVDRMATEENRLCAEIKRGKEARARAEAAETALAAERAKTAKLVDLLCLADEAIMQEHGCFPLDRTNERQIFLNDACTAIRKITGDDYTERKRRARAAITEAGQ